MLGADYMTILYNKVTEPHSGGWRIGAETENDSKPCDFCGRETGAMMGDRYVCDDCATEMGSCCPEFGHADLHNN